MLLRARLWQPRREARPSFVAQTKSFRLDYPLDYPKDLLCYPHRLHSLGTLVVSGLGVCLYLRAHGHRLAIIHLPIFNRSVGPLYLFSFGDNVSFGHSLSFGHSRILRRHSPQLIPGYYAGRNVDLFGGGGFDGGDGLGWLANRFVFHPDMISPHDHARRHVARANFHGLAWY